METERASKTPDVTPTLHTGQCPCNIIAWWCYWRTKHMTLLLFGWHLICLCFTECVTLMKDMNTVFPK